MDLFERAPLLARLGRLGLEERLKLERDLSMARVERRSA